MGVSFILKAKVTVHAVGFPLAYSFVSRRLQSLSLLCLHSGDELFLLVVRKQAAEITCEGVRSTACGRCSAKAPHPSLVFLMKLVKILRERFWKRHVFWSGWDWMQTLQHVLGLAHKKFSLSSLVFISFWIWLFPRTERRKQSFQPTFALLLDCSETYHSLGWSPETGENLQCLHDGHSPCHYSK